MLTSVLWQLDRRAGAVLLAGVAGVLAYNWHLWRRDTARAASIRAGYTPVPALSHTPVVSALVAAWNEGDGIEAHLESFLALSYPAIELILCAGGDDKTLARARRFAGPRVTVLEQRQGEGKQRALARCLEHASGEIIYLTDADCRFDDEALLRLLAPLIDEGEQAATGASRPLDEQAGRLLPLYLWVADAYVQAQYGRYLSGLLGRNAAITRSALGMIDSLSFDAPTGTDYHTARRLIELGVKIRFVSESCVRSAYPETILTYWHKQSRWLRNLLIYGFTYRAYHQMFNTLRTAMVGSGMLILTGAATLKRKHALVLWSLFVWHAMLSKLRYCAFACAIERQSFQVPQLKFIISLFPLTMFDFVIWVTPVFQALHPKERRRW